MGSNPIQVATFLLSIAFLLGKTNAFVAQLVEQRTENPRVVGSIPTEGTICGFSSSGRAPPCQGGGSEFEPRNPLQKGSAQEGWSFLTYWTLSNFCGFSSSGRAPPSQGGCGEFESRNPLHQAEPGCSIAHLLKSRCISFLPANGS